MHYGPWAVYDHIGRIGGLPSFGHFAFSDLLSSTQDVFGTSAGLEALSDRSVLNMRKARQRSYVHVFYGRHSYFCRGKHDSGSARQLPRIHRTDTNLEPFVGLEELPYDDCLRSWNFYDDADSDGLV
jgi:hypothetical protein